MAWQGRAGRGEAWRYKARNLKEQQMSNTTERPNFAPSAEAQSIAKRLLQCEIGEIVTYDEMTAICGETELEAIRGWIASARKRVQAENNMVFGTVTGVGLKRLDDCGIIDASKQRIDHIRRSTRRAAKTLACAEIDHLPNGKKTEALCLQAQIGAMRLASSTGAQHQIEQRILQGKKMEVGRIMDLFRG